MTQPPKLFPLIGESRSTLQAKLLENLLRMFAAESRMKSQQEEYEREVEPLGNNVRRIVEQLRLQEANAAKAGSSEAEGTEREVSK
jgi:hypothetical protein